VPAAAGAIVMVLLLGYKQRMHGWVETLSRAENDLPFQRWQRPHQTVARWPTTAPLSVAPQRGHRAPARP